MIEFTIPMPRSTNNLFATVGKRRIPSVKYVEWRKNAGKMIQTQRIKTLIPHGDLIADLTVGPRNKRADLDNKIKAALDVLVWMHLIRDDSLALARVEWPDLDSHSLGALTYALNPPALAREMTRGAHSAEADVILCGFLFMAIYKRRGWQSWKEAYAASEIARIPTRWPIGKHKGEPIRSAPPDYIAWMLKQPDIDPYLRKALIGNADL